MADLCVLNFAFPECDLRKTSLMIAGASVKALTSFSLFVFACLTAKTHHYRTLFSHAPACLAVIDYNAALSILVFYEFLAALAMADVYFRNRYMIDPERSTGPFLATCCLAVMAVVPSVALFTTYALALALHGTELLATCSNLLVPPTLYYVLTCTQASTMYVWLAFWDYCDESNDTVRGEPIMLDNDDGELPERRIRPDISGKHRSANSMESAESSASSSEVDCAVCLGGFSPRSRVTRLRCLHEFHSECVAAWFERDDSCPVCRTSIT